MYSPLGAPSIPGADGDAARRGSRRPPPVRSGKFGSEDPDDWTLRGKQPLPGRRKPFSEWQPTPALRRSFLVIGVALVAGIALGRIDLLAFALPFAIGVAVTLSRRPLRVPQAGLVETDTVTTMEGERVSSVVEIRNDSHADVVAQVRVNPARWLRMDRGDGWQIRGVDAEQTARIDIEATVLRWGTHRLGPVYVEMIAADGLLQANPARVRERQLRVYPSAALFDSDQPLVRAAGLAGVHHARRLGEGGELAEVRQFQPGDRLRRIDWRVSLRQQQLHVDATFSERDTDVVVLLDSAYDVGPYRGITSLDLSVRAAAALARHYTRQGDRVAIAELSSRQHHLRGGTGRRQYILALEWLTAIRASGGIGVAVDRLLRTGLIPSGATVIVLTPLLGDASVGALARLARSGRPLVAVDVLPDGASPDKIGKWTDLAWRLWWAERQNTVNRLRGIGVPLHQWRGPGSLDQLLRQVAVLDRAAKVVRR